MLPLVLPEIIVAVSLIVMLMQLGLSLSLWTVVAGHVLICTPFSIAILSSAFAGLDQSLEEASFDLGESRWGTFRRVTLPLVMPGVISSLLICFTISLDEFIIAFFLTGTDATLPVYIWSQLRFPTKLPSVMALGTILLALSVGLLLLAEWFRRRAVRRQGLDASSSEGLL
jgi:spermidine/putrescine transport system permease protein